MSDPIKPPDGPEAPDPTADGPEGVAEGAPGEFRAAVDAAGAANAPLLEGLKANAIDPTHAVEQLVERALTAAQGLSEAQREQLESQLRAALAEDPTLVALQEDLRRVAKV